MASLKRLTTQNLNEIKKRKTEPELNSQRIDYLMMTPLDILKAIFDFLNNIDLSTCMRVCKFWKKICSEPSRLAWTEIEFFNTNEAIFYLNLPQYKEIQYLTFKNLFLNQELSYHIDFLIQHNKLVSFTMENCKFFIPSFFIALDSLKDNISLKELHLLGNDTYIVQYMRIIAEILKVNKALTQLSLRITNNHQGLNLIMEALKVNRTVTRLNIQGGPMSDGTAIAETLKVNQSLKHLEFRDGVVDDRRVKVIIESLKITQSLTCLDFSNNKIGDEKENIGAKTIAEFLKTNQTLTSLNLQSTSISKGIEIIMEALKLNRTLMRLNLRFNEIGNEDSMLIAEMLKINETLVHLNLEQNWIGIRGSKFIVDALKINRTLVYLNFASNNIGNEGAKIFAEMWINNHTLMHLDLSNNNIGMEGSKIFTEAATLRYNQILHIKSLVK